MTLVAACYYKSFGLTVIFLAVQILRAGVVLSELHSLAGERRSLPFGGCCGTDDIF